MHTRHLTNLALILLSCAAGACDSREDAVGLSGTPAPPSVPPSAAPDPIKAPQPKAPTPVPGASEEPSTNPKHPAPSSATSAAAGPPSRRALFDVVLGLLTTPMQGTAHCDSLADEETHTIGDSLARAFAWADEDALVASADCEPTGEPDGPWFCKVQLLVPDEWSWGVSFQLRADGKTVVPDSIVCISMP